MTRSTKPEPGLRLMSRLGAIEVPAHDHSLTANRVDAERADASADSPKDDFFIPDFCAARMVFAVVLIAELLAVTFALARPGVPFLTELARISLFLQWLGLTSAGVLCYVRPYLKGLAVPWASAAVFALMIANTALISELAVWLGANVAVGGPNETLFPDEHWPFVLRNEGICVIVTAMLLRYFFVTQQWRHHVRAEARSRIEALQARIRPHFLFNSMNTIASLTRTDPARAEEAVEDLADLFRATLRDSAKPLRLKDELELTRIYQRIEQLRLGARLEVRWSVDGLPMRALVPSLTLQPLLENAIYHGIEPLDAGGTVTIAGRVDDRKVRITVTNPLGAAHPSLGRSGNRLALENIRQRLQLAYGGRASLEVEQRADEYRVTLCFPLEE
jgi:two-component system, LytTR family, sensor histidine kinase AlgZ